MSVITQDRGTILASGRVVLLDEDTAEVRAVGVRSYIVEGAGVISFELEQPASELEAHIIARRLDNADGQVTAEIDLVDLRAFFFVWSAAGAVDKSGAFYFEISRVVGGSVVVDDLPVPP